MSNIESNCNWHFSEQEDATQDIGPNNAAAEYFSETPYPSLIRESIQNSLDAASDSSKPVRMEFSFKQLRTGSYPNFFNLRNHIESILKYYGNKAEAEYGPMLDVFHNFESNQASRSPILIPKEWTLIRMIQILLSMHLSEPLV